MLRQYYFPCTHHASMHASVFQENKFRELAGLAQEEHFEKSYIIFLLSCSFPTSILYKYRPTNHTALWMNISQGHGMPKLRLVESDDAYFEYFTFYSDCWILRSMSRMSASNFDNDGNPNEMIQSWVFGVPKISQRLHTPYMQPEPL